MFTTRTALHSLSHSTHSLLKPPSSTAVLLQLFSAITWPKLWFYKPIYSKKTQGCLHRRPLALSPPRTAVNPITPPLFWACTLVVEVERGKLVVNISMYTVETKVGSLWNECLNHNDARSDNRKLEIVKPGNLDHGIAALVTSLGVIGPEIAIDVGKPTWRIIKWDGSNHSWEELDAESDEGCPSKFLIMCLNSIQNALHQDDGAFGSLDGRPFFAHSWGFEFWSCYNNGNDVLDTDGGDSKIEKIAWITSTAADTISTKEKEGVSFNYPFLLYLVPSQDKANKVLQVCKPLEDVGLYTMFLHSGVSIDLQIQSLKSSEPEFIVSTPDRLLELLSSKAIDISDLSLMVIDGLEAPFGGTYLDALKSIRQFTSGNTRTVIFCDSTNSLSGSVCC